MSDKRCGILRDHDPHSWGGLNWCPGTPTPEPSDFHEHDAAGCLDCSCASAPMNSAPCTCPTPVPSEVEDSPDEERCEHGIPAYATCEACATVPSECYNYRLHGRAVTCPACGFRGPVDRSAYPEHTPTPESSEVAETTGGEAWWCTAQRESRSTPCCTACVPAADQRVADAAQSIALMPPEHGLRAVVAGNLTGHSHCCVCSVCDFIRDTPTPAPSEVAETTADEHHPACYQSTGVPDHLPAGLCDCKVLRMLDAAETTAGEREVSHNGQIPNMGRAGMSHNEHATAGEREVRALAKALYEQIEWGGCDGASWDRAGSGIRGHWTQAAERILASDWIAALLDRVRREEGERIAQAIEAHAEANLGPESRRHYNAAARIARAASVGREEGL